MSKIKGRCINFKPVRLAQPGVKGGGDYKYYARLCNTVTLDEWDIARDVNDATSFTAADLHHAIIDMIHQITKQLSMGNNVKFGDLGTFSVSLRSRGADSARELTTHYITDKVIQFRPSPHMKKIIKLAHCKKWDGR